MVDKFCGPVLDLLAPARCFWCRRRAAAASPACSPCAAALPWNAPACRTCGIPLGAEGTGSCGDCLRDCPPQDASWAAFRYEAPIAQAIVDLKFHGRLTPAHVVGRLMAQIGRAHV